MPAQIFIGTSGYSYKDWKECFYPAGLNPGDYLSYYSRHFDACELNFSYYRMPSPDMFINMIVKSEGMVTFTVKAHQSITHERQDSEKSLETFLSTLEPLISEKKLGAVLLQFPYSFRNNQSNREYLERTIEKVVQTADPVVEFRNAEWISEETYSLLKYYGAGFCCVDEPFLKGLLPRTAIATSDTGYIRFHGRNARDWWKPEDSSQRYNYLYPDEELNEWIPKIKQIAEKASKIFIFMNNHYTGKAIINAKRLRELVHDLF
jgi:uncharacterized protein YecE (DUF72 family)